MKRSEIAENMHIALISVNRIASCESYEEYKGKISTYYLKKKAEKAEKKESAKPAEPAEPEAEQKDVEKQLVEHRQTVIVQATNYMMEEIKKVNEQLALLNNKLAFIVEELVR